MPFGWKRIFTLWPLFPLSVDCNAVFTHPRSHPCLPSGEHFRNLPCLSASRLLFHLGCVCVHVCTRSVALSNPTLCDPLDRSPPGSSIHGIFQARRLEWGVISYFRGSSLSRDRTRIPCVSCIAARFFTAEPSRKPLYICNSLLSK